MIGKRVLQVALVAVVYQSIAMLALYNSSVLNLGAYYTHPPIKAGEIELQRLPMFWGEQAAIFFLERYKKNEINILMNNESIGMSAVLTSYEGNDALDLELARSRVIDLAKVYIENGYDLRKCEYKGLSTASILDEWGMLDDVNFNFLMQYLSKEELFICSENTQLGRVGT